jgi:hypothetical protein
VGGVAAGVALLVCIGLAIYTCGRRRARSDIDHEKGKAREEEHLAEEVHALQEQVHRLEEERDKVGRGEEQPPSYFASWKNR